MAASRRARLVGAWGALISGLVACGSSAQPAGVPGAAGELTRRDTAIVHEPCDTDSSSASKGDANGDGRADLVTVKSGNKPVCQWMDLNFDQVGDVWIYYGADGAVRRRETDFDRDGRVDELTTLTGGVIASRQRATTLAGRLDTWQYFKAGVLERGERDANGDGVIDQWWEYPISDKLQCAIVHSDTNGDGRPDPGATVDLCASDDSALEDSDGDEQLPPPDAPITESTVATPEPAVAQPAVSETPTDRPPEGNKQTGGSRP